MTEADDEMMNQLEDRLSKACFGNDYNEYEFLSWIRSCLQDYFDLLDTTHSTDEFGIYQPPDPE